MKINTFENVSDFLGETLSTLETAESTYNLVYGLALSLQRHPERIKIPPYLGVVQHHGRVVAAGLMTPPHHLIVLSADPEPDSDAFNLLACNLAENQWRVPGVIGPSPVSAGFVRAWQAQTGETALLAMHERIFELRQVIRPPQPSGAMRMAVQADLELAAGWLLAFNQEALPAEELTLDESREIVQVKIDDQDVYLWEDSTPVALAGRGRRTPHGCSIGPVYTPPVARRKGYATALTAMLSQRLLNSGLEFTCLFTDLANPTSNRIYQKIGYRPICDFDVYQFEKTTPS